MKRALIIICFFGIAMLSLKPVMVEYYQPINLPSVKINETQNVAVLENHTTEYSDPNNSFERIHLLTDTVSDTYGYRPFPWGGEIFGGSPAFLCDSSIARTGNYSYRISGNSDDDIGALAVPDLQFKPLVTPGKIYYLSFWVNYNIKSGHGFHVLHQFFREEDFPNPPSYVSYGPWIKGSSKGEWIQIGLLVQAPQDAWCGDPVIALWGTGELLVDDAFFGEVKID